MPELYDQDRDWTMAELENAALCILTVLLGWTSLLLTSVAVFVLR